MTFDSYKTIETGITYILDCTHGYHKTTVHLTAKYPGLSKNVNNPITVLPYKVWIAIFFSLSIFTLYTLSVINVYERIRPQIVKPNLESSQVVLRLMSGLTEPDDEAWFRNYSSGN